MFIKIILLDWVTSGLILTAGIDGNAEEPVSIIRLMLRTHA